MKKETVILAAYGVGLAFLAYVVYKIIEAVPTGAKVSAALDQAATDEGLQESQAQYGPQTLYDQARSDYAASIGWDLTGNGVLTVPGWPGYNEWVKGGIGPDGYTYGSDDYPLVPAALGWWGNIENRLGQVF